jgi:hypothetical protein
MSLPISGLVGIGTPAKSGIIYVKIVNNVMTVKVTVKVTL